ncbi:uncharacterized protein C2845_PM14G07830 [Panicum miliaceum]|uniref:DNA-directed RNA polymerase III subunit RPC5 n=1 Tax=Panicum miliaceum TaxID=4540 RepID=A0A3L6PMA9_PANMI|nr:uncharacterized protein C2845_PM14G07830 [Panicum miliaceum]
MATGGEKPPSLDADVDMADLASLDAPAASSAAAAGAPSTRFRPRAKGKPKPKPVAPKPEPLVVPKSEPEPDPDPEPEPVSVPEPWPGPVADPAAPQEDDRVDAMEVDGAGDAAGPGEGAAAGEEAEDEEEDFVVREIDVYFNPKPFDDETKLYIMQYPLRPCWRPYELNEICEEVRVKPLSSEVEVDLSVNKQSENYDQEAPLRLTKQQAAHQSRGGERKRYMCTDSRPREDGEVEWMSEQKGYEPDERLDVDLGGLDWSQQKGREPLDQAFVMTLSSSKAEDVSDYAVGVLKGNLGQVHLNHIDAVVQLRPSMSHVISGRAYNRQALQSREMNGGASGSKAPSRKGDERAEDSKDHAEDSEPRRRGEGGGSSPAARGSGDADLQHAGRAGAAAAREPRVGAPLGAGRGSSTLRAGVAGPGPRLQHHL